MTQSVWWQVIRRLSFSSVIFLPHSPEFLNLRSGNGKISSLDLLVTLYSNKLIFWAASTHYCLMSNFISTIIPKFFSKDLPSIHSSPSLYWSCELPQSRCRTLHIALLNSTEFTWMPFSNLPRPLWMPLLPWSFSTASLSFVSLENLLRVHSVPRSMPLIRIWNNISPSMGSGRCLCLQQEHWTRWSLKDPSSTNNSTILCF